MEDILDYVKKAQESAEARRVQLENERVKQDEEIKKITRMISELGNTLETGLKQWNGVLQLEYCKVGEYKPSHIIKKDNKIVIEVNVGWGMESRSYSDDCTVDHEGPKVTVRFPYKDELVWCDISKHQVRTTFCREHIGNYPEDTAKYAFEQIADFISKEYM